MDSVNVAFHRACWKVNSRWDGRSLLDIFYSEKLLFVGNEEEKAAGFKSIHEGDLILVLDGYRVVALAEAEGPASEEMNFKWRNARAQALAGQLFDLGADWVLAVRVRLIGLDEKDRWDYPDRKRFSAVQNDEHRARAERLWAEYMAREEKINRGLFDWATSELSQDAFFCWLLSFLSSAEASAEHTVATRLIAALTGDEGFAKGTVTIHKQWANIDVLVGMNEKAEDKSQRRFLVIEDKVGAQLYNDLIKYRQSVCAAFGVPPEQVKCAVIKTEDDGLLDEVLNGMKPEDRPRKMLRKELLSILDESSVTSGHLREFVDHLKEIDAAYDTWRTVPYKEWKANSDLAWNAWRGLYSALLEAGCGFTKWFYVNNASRPFNAMLHDGWSPVYDEKYSIYPQTDSSRAELHLKVGEVPAEDRYALRSRLLADIEAIREAGELPPVLKAMHRPARLGSGWYMTLQILPDQTKDGQGWIVLDDNGMVDVSKTAKRLQEICAAIGELSKKITARASTQG